MAAVDQSTKSKATKQKSVTKPLKSTAPRTVAAPPTEKLKVVVRRLPPNLPEDIFWQSVEQWVKDDTVTWRVFYPGKLRKSLRLNKESIPSRAYISFKTQEQLAVFSQAYDGHLFRDKAGNESVAVVEFAPHQKIPPEKKKLDARHNTIEQDEDYISFINSLSATAPKLSEAEAIELLAASVQPAPEPKSTPLLDALKAEKSAARDKEAILRNHAHYLHQQEAPNNSGQSKKDEAKKKGAGKQSDELPGNKKNARGKKTETKSAAPSLQVSAPQTAPSTAGGPSATTKPASAASLPSKPAMPIQIKPSRPPRENISPKASPSTSETKPSSPPQNSPLTVPSSRADNGSRAASPAAATTPRERRTRPMLGLQSRQFSAALSGAGVHLSPDGGKVGRREREKKAEGSQGPTPSPDTVTSTKEPDNKSKDRRSSVSSVQAQPSNLQPEPNTLARTQTPKPAARGGTHDDTQASPRGANRRGRVRGRGGAPP